MIRFNDGNRRPAAPILPPLPPLFNTARSTPTSQINSDPPSPSTPNSPVQEYFAPLATVLNEPWNLRIKGSGSSRRHPLSPSTSPPSRPGLPSFAKSQPPPDQPRFSPLPPPLPSPNASLSIPPDILDGGTPLSRMSSSGALKRKVVIMGSPSVGKTSLTQQFIAPPTYNESYFPTIEATSHKNVSHDGVDYECEIIDSAGQDEYTLFPSKYAVGVHGYLLVYSINSRQSFEMIQTVHDKILDFAGLEKVPCVVVGQKCDLNSERRVTFAEGEALAKKMNAAFVESSAKDNKNVGKAFEILLKEMQREYNPAPEKKKSSWWGWGK